MIRYTAADTQKRINELVKASLAVFNKCRKSKRTSPLRPMLYVLSHMTLTEVLWVRAYFSHLQGEETEALRCFKQLTQG